MRSEFRLLLFLFACTFGCAQEERNIASEKRLFALVEAGDLVFRRGGGVASRAVLVADAGGTYSHVGVVVEDGKVIHSVPEGGVKIEKLEEFFAPRAALRGAVMRVQVSLERVMELAAPFEGTGFDHNYDLADSTKVYCTELVWRVFNRLGVDLTEGRRSRISVPGFDGEYILPSDLAKCKRLVEVWAY